VHVVKSTNSTRPYPEIFWLQSYHHDAFHANLKKPREEKAFPAETPMMTTQREKVYAEKGQDRTCFS
jgi:hypothetical protein